MLNLIDKINLNSELKNKVIDLAQKDKVNIMSLADKCKDGNYKCLVYKSDLKRLAVIIQTAEYTLDKYKMLGIPESVFFDTLDDIRIWCENNNNKGLKNYNWIKNHISCELFKLGRLQFQICKCTDVKLNYSLFPFNRGENIIYVHIPQGEKLAYSECVSSLKSAVQFFEKYFPEYNYNYFYCESWLLYEGNCQFMLPSSNIMKFSSLFNVICSFDIDSQAIERIFKKRHFNKKSYPEDTTLQRNAKKHIIDAGKLGVGVGIIYKNDLV